jgi:hypothetical protein
VDIGRGEGSKIHLVMRNGMKDYVGGGISAIGNFMIKWSVRVGISGV